MRFTPIFRITIPHDGASHFKVVPPNGLSPGAGEMTIINEALRQLQQSG